jgi:hypothetical protein
LRSFDENMTKYQQNGQNNMQLAEEYIEIQNLMQLDKYLVLYIWENMDSDPEKQDANVINFMVQSRP